MSCSNDWTLTFRGVNDPDEPDFEVRPVTISFTNTRIGYDFCRAKLPWEVGQHMKPETESLDGRLRGFTEVDISLDGDIVRKLLFRPDWIEYGDEFATLQLHDLQKSLADGVVDEERNSIQLTEIYKTIVNSASNDVLTDVVFTLPDNQVRTIYGENGLVQVASNASVDKLQKINRAETQKVIASNYAIDFNQITPEEAITRLNKKFRIRSWVNRDKELVVGIPESSNVKHLAAPNDHRVWRWKDPSITHPREPVRSVVVKGSWVDDPGLEPNPLEWFDKGGTADVRAVGIAQRDDVTEGTTFTVDAKGAKRNSLEGVATVVLREEVKKQNTGTVEIDPALSGETVSSPIDVEPGDFIRLVPDDSLFENPTADSGEIGDEPDTDGPVCGSFVNNESYLISEVEHNVTKQGDWQIFLNLALVPDVPISSKLTFFNPKDDTYISAEKVEDGELKGGWLSLEDI